MSKWTKEEPTEDGYYWVMRNTKFEKPRMEIVYVYTSIDELIGGMKFALNINSDYGDQMFDFSWWKKIDMPVSPEASSYCTHPLHFRRNLIDG